MPSAPLTPTCPRGGRHCRAPGVCVWSPVPGHPGWPWRGRGWGGQWAGLREDEPCREHQEQSATPLRVGWRAQAGAGHALPEPLSPSAGRDGGPEVDVSAAWPRGGATAWTVSPLWSSQPVAVGPAPGRRTALWAEAGVLTASRAGWSRQAPRCSPLPPERPSFVSPPLRASGPSLGVPAGVGIDCCPPPHPGPCHDTGQEAWPGRPTACRGRAGPWRACGRGVGTSSGGALGPLGIVLGGAPCLPSRSGPLPATGGSHLEPAAVRGPRWTSATVLSGLPGAGRARAPSPWCCRRGAGPSVRPHESSLSLSCLRGVGIEVPVGKIRWLGAALKDWLQEWGLCGGHEACAVSAPWIEGETAPKVGAGPGPSAPGWSPMATAQSRPVLTPPPPPPRPLRTGLPAGPCQKLCLRSLASPGNPALCRDLGGPGS